MPANSVKPRRRWGCLTRLLVFVLFMGACYWLLLAPIPERDTDQTQGTPTLEVPSERVSVEGEINPTQQAALEELADESGGRADVLAQNGQIQYLTVNVKVPDSVAVSAQEKAFYFLKQNPELFQLGELSQTLRFEEKTTDDLGNTYVRYVQQYQGIPVNGSGFVIGVSQDGSVFSVNANYVPNLKIDVQPSIRSTRAEEVALTDMNADDGSLMTPTTLEIFASELFENSAINIGTRLSWFVTVGSETKGELWLYIIDAQNGTILTRNDLILRAGGLLDLEIWEKGTGSIIYTLVMDEAGSRQNNSPSEYSENAFDHAWEIYRYYYDNFNRDSYDNKGSKLVLRVNLGNCTDTAYFSPSQPINLQLKPHIYFCRDFTIPRDTMAHEFTHAVIGYTAKLGSSGEARELNEGIADIFAAFSSTDGSPWQLNWPRGNGLLRDMASPQQGFNPDYPTHYDERYCDRTDASCIKKCPEKMGEYEEQYTDCGHVNSLVFSHAAYLMSKEADSVNGIPRNKLQHLYYYVLNTRQIQTKTNQHQAARAIIDSCNRILGRKELVKGRPLPSPFTKEDCAQISKAFVDVGLKAPDIVPPDIPTIPLPQLPEIPNLADLINNLREKLRKAVDELLGDWSPIKLWNQIQEEIEKIRNNYWVKLLECIKNSDQACIDKYATDLINAVFEMVLNTLCNFCSSIFIVPAAVFAIRRQKRMSH